MTKLFLVILFFLKENINVGRIGLIENRIKKIGDDVEMDFFVWDDSYSVNVKEIDNQHRKLIEMVNNFYLDIEKNNKESLKTLLRGLVDYTEYHFSTEERYFEKFNYSKLKAHKKSHDSFVKKVKDVKEKYDDGKLVLSFEITDFLKNWLIEHIKGEDKEFKECFNENGLY